MKEMTVIHAGSQRVLKRLSVIRGRSSRISSRCLDTNISFSAERQNNTDHATIYDLRI